ncbi:MAG: dehypoxanthine futalosine cyclase [Myxococcales bacterium FL481]|nr:MAG: dehypoxanthine futalosine cyclase [Myxococcales bacterium FL481]
MSRSGPASPPSPPRGTEPIVVHAVSFLNARPLLRGLEAAARESGGREIQLRTDLPSACADDLAAGRCDVALIPVASCLDHPEWEIVPGVAIGCRGPVDTVVLAAAVPLEQVEHVLLDAASRTSNRLVEMLLRERGVTASFEIAEHRTGESRIRGTTAALVIGDAAFGIGARHAYTYDLGQWWFESTRLPFVFAVWAARPGVLTPEVVEVFEQVADKNRRRYAERIAGEYRAERLALGEPCEPEHVYANYLRKVIRYRLDTATREGLVEFLAQACGSTSAEDDDRVHLQFAGAQHTTASIARRPRTPFDLERVVAKVHAGERLEFDEGIFLYENAPLLTLGEAADHRRKQLHPDAVVSYIVDRNVNYTNVCVTRCQFCNFYTPPGGKNGYVLSKDQLAEKFRETEALGGVQILLQGGLNPELGLAYYEDLFRWTKANFSLKLHALSPTEIVHIADMENLSVRDVLRRLQSAGMDSIPGGGAEILDDEIRSRISPFKNGTEEWLDVMRQAHALGMRSTATMVFGFQETTEHIVAHLDRLRALQDETDGFTAFIVWPFQAENTRLKLRDDTSPARYLRLQALARLYLDNIPNIQVSWPTLGPEIGELALRFGANDFGSVMIEENVVSTAGAHFMLTAQQIEHHIRQAGFTPARRNMQYDRLAAQPA